jgi:hypothetical protein
MTIFVHGTICTGLYVPRREPIADTGVVLKVVCSMIVGKLRTSLYAAEFIWLLNLYGCSSDKGEELNRCNFLCQIGNGRQGLQYK